MEEEGSAVLSVLIRPFDAAADSVGAPHSASPERSGRSLHSCLESEQSRNHLGGHMTERAQVEEASLVCVCVCQYRWWSHPAGHPLSLIGSVEKVDSEVHPEQCVCVCVWTELLVSTDTPVIDSHSC